MMRAGIYSIEVLSYEASYCRGCQHMFLFLRKRINIDELPKDVAMVLDEGRYMVNRPFTSNESSIRG